MNDLIRITEIKQSDKGGLFSVYTESGYEFSLSVKGMYETGISEGKSFSSDDFEAVRLYAAEERVFRRAVYLLGNREYSSGELLDKLRSEGENGEKAVERLVDLGYIDDMRYAEKIIEKYSESYGIRRVEEELRRRFIDREISEELLATFSDGADEKIFKLLYLKMKGRPFCDAAEKNRMFAFFLRRGFVSDNIKKAFGNYADEEFDI